MVKPVEPIEPTEAPGAMGIPRCAWGMGAIGAIAAAGASAPARAPIWKRCGMNLRKLAWLKVRGERCSFEITGDT